MRLSGFLVIFLFLIFISLPISLGYSLNYVGSYTKSGDDTILSVQQINSSSYSVRYNTHDVDNGKYKTAKLATTTFLYSSIYISNDVFSLYDISHDGKYLYSGVAGADQIIILRVSDLQLLSDINTTRITNSIGVTSLQLNNQYDFLFYYGTSNTTISIFKYDKYNNRSSYIGKISPHAYNGICDKFTTTGHDLTTNDYGLYIFCSKTNTNGQNGTIIKYVFSNNTFIFEKLINVSQYHFLHTTDFAGSQYNMLVSADKEQYNIYFQNRVGAESDVYSLSGADRPLILFRSGNSTANTIYYFDKDLNYLSNSSFNHVDTINAFGSFRSHNLGNVINNSLPTFTVNYSSDKVCLNNSKGYSDFYFTINATDRNNDQIYYSINPAFSLKANRIYDFDSYSVTGTSTADRSEWNVMDDGTLWQQINYWTCCKIDPFINWLSGFTGNEGNCCDQRTMYDVSIRIDDAQFIDTLCNITLPEYSTNFLGDTSQSPQSTFMSTNEDYQLQWNFDDMTKYNLKVTSKCNKPVQMLLPSKTYRNFDSYLSYLINPENTSSILVGIYDGYGHQNIGTPIKINRTNGKIYVSYITTRIYETDSKWLKVLEFVDYTNSKIFYSFSDFSGYGTNVANSTYNVSYSSEFGPFTSIKFDGTGNYSLDDISFYNGMNPGFSTTYNNHLQLNFSDQTLLTIYVSDTIHKDIPQFEYKTLVLTVDKQYCGSSMTGKDIVKDVGRGIFGSLLTSLGIQDEVYQYAWYAMVVMMIIMLLITFSLTMASMTTGFTFALAGYIGLANTTLMMTAVVLFIMPIVPQLVSFFTGGGNDR